MNVPALLTARLVCALVLLPLLFGITGAVSPTVTDITPDAEENTTRVFTATISGSDFATGAQVLLVPAAARPVHAGSIVDGGSIAPFLNGPQAVFLSGTNAYIVNQGSNALEIVDVADPGHPVHKGSLLNGAGGALIRAPMDVVVSGTHAYVTSSGSNALEIIDVADPASPVHMGSITNGTGGALLTSPRAVAVSGDYAYVTGYTSNSLEVVDISDPASPVHAGTLRDDTLLKNPTGIFVSGTFAYLTSSGNNALEVVDISDPAHPVHAGLLKDGGGSVPYLKSPAAVTIAGKYAYVASFGSHALEIVDVTSPAHPVHKGALANGIGGARLGNPAGVYVSGRSAYVASSGGNALEIVDVSNPAVPVHLGTLIDGTDGALLNTPSGVSVAGPYAYVTGRTGNSLEIVDIGSVTSIPAGSITVRSGSLITCTFNLTGAMAGEYTVVVANPGGLQGTLAGGFTITAPQPPPLVTSISPSGGTNATIVQITDLTGSNFNTTAAPRVKLNRTGFTDILATNVTALRSTHLICTFDLTGQEAGSWNVVVTNPDGQEGLLKNGFSVLLQVPTTPPTTVPTSLPTEVPTIPPTAVPTTTPPVPPPESTPLPAITGSGSSVPESGISGRGISSVATSPGAPAGGTLSFAFDDAESAGFARYPYAITAATFVPSRPLGPTDLILADAGMTVLPPGNGRITAGIVSLEPVAVNPSAISSGTITFAVADAWLRSNGLTPAHIALMHLEEGRWSELPTTYMNHSGEAHYFTATTPGFSYLAISTRSTMNPVNATVSMNAAVPSLTISTPVESAAPALPPTAPDTRAGDGTPVIVRTTLIPAKNDVPQASGTWTLAAACGCAGVATAGGLYLRRWWTRRQNPALLRKYD